MAWRPDSIGGKPGNKTTIRVPLMPRTPKEPTLTTSAGLLRKANRAMPNAGFPPEKPMTIGKLMTRLKPPRMGA